MFAKRLLVALISLLLVAGVVAAKGPPLPPPDPGRGSIGVAIKAKPPAKIGNMAAVQVFFVRLDGDTDAFTADDVIVSNYSNKNQVYLLNADPGRYVAVAAGLKGGQAPPATGGSGQSGVSVTYSVSFDYQAFFSMEMIPETEVEVVPNEMAFMGDFRVNTSTKIKKADEAQSHYLQLLAPNAVGKGFMARAFSGQAVYTAKLTNASKDSAAGLEFWTKARDKTFKKHPEWQTRVDQHLKHLGE